MRTIDNPLPTAAPAPGPALELPTIPATRAELLDLITQLTQRATMPPSVKNARFVRVPADLYLEAHSIVLRELNSVSAQ